MIWSRSMLSPYEEGPAQKSEAFIGIERERGVYLKRVSFFVSSLLPAFMRAK
jgi:hypothetical protein